MNDGGGLAIFPALMGMFIGFLGSALLTMPLVSSAEYYILPTGSASWSQCSSVTNPCSLTTANANAQAGDTVYLMGGTYALSGVSSKGINPTNSGTLGAMITYSGHDGQEVLIKGDGSSDQWGISLSGKNFIVINGITFVDQHRPAELIASSHNEIKNCEFYHSGEGLYDSQYNGIHLKFNSTHNWIHHNVVHTMGSSGCDEGWDLIKIGDTTNFNDNWNTVENNILYSAGHTLTDDFGKYNVWKNNTGHNEGWKPSSNVAGTATGGSSSTLVDTSKDFVALGVQAGHFIYSATHFNKGGVVTSVSNDTIHFIGRDAFGAPAFSNGSVYSVSPCKEANDPSGTNPGNGRYGHRVFAWTGYETGANHRYNLFEGNRAGYASVNPVNGGADGFTAGSPGNIIRYNAFYGCDGPGINLKSYGDTGHSGANNRIYSNTVYRNGRAVFSQAASPLPRTGVYQYSAYSAGNIVVNNLFFQNGPSPFTDFANVDFGTNTLVNNWCVNAVEGCALRSGDPKFVNPDLSDMASTLLPDLTLQSISGAIDAGTFLTTASGAGTNSLYLVVQDALHFQDGSWGSDLARNITHFPDWIAVGNVAKVVQISSIDYSTNTLTLATPITWSDGDRVWLYRKSDGARVLYGSAPDIGAYEYADGQVCGNDVAEAGEVCDGLDLRGQDCLSIGTDYSGGALACDIDCARFNTAGCTRNSTIDGDLNGDRAVNLQDLILVAQNVGKAGFDPRADIAAPLGAIDLFDLMVVVRNWGRSS